MVVSQIVCHSHCVSLCGCVCASVCVCVAVCVCGYVALAVCASLQAFYFRERSAEVTLQPAGACRRGVVVSLVKRGKI